MAAQEKAKAARLEEIRILTQRNQGRKEAGSSPGQKLRGEPDPPGPRSEGEHDAEGSRASEPGPKAPEAKKTVRIESLVDLDSEDSPVRSPTGTSARSCPTPDSRKTRVPLQEETPSGAAATADAEARPSPAETDFGGGNEHSVSTRGQDEAPEEVERTAGAGEEIEMPLSIPSSPTEMPVPSWAPSPITDLRPENEPEDSPGEQGDTEIEDASEADRARGPAEGSREQAF